MPPLLTFNDAWPFIDSIGGFYERDEMELLWTEAARVPKEGHILEIGCEQGRSTSCLLLASRAFLTIIDPFIYGEETRTAFIENMRRLRKEFNRKEPFMYDLIQERSQECLIDGKFDLIHVDGGHDLEDVLTDCVRFESRTKSGGIMTVHDYGRESLPDVQAAVDQFLASRSMTWSKVQRTGTLLTIRKVA